MKYAKISPKAMGMAGGILWGGSTAFFAIMVMAGLPGKEIIEFLNQFYLGYDVSIVGAILGFIWGFIDGGIGGWLLAWLYNYFS